MAEQTFTFSDLETSLGEILAKARTDTIRLTDKNGSSYILISEKAFEEHLQSAIEEAVYAEHMTQAIRQGEANIKAGRICNAKDLFTKAVGRRRDQ